MSAEPDMLGLLSRLHVQLKDAKLPSWIETPMDAAQEVRRAARGVKALLVLDEMGTKTPASIARHVMLSDKQSRQGMGHAQSGTLREARKSLFLSTYPCEMKRKSPDASATRRPSGTRSPIGSPLSN